MPIDADAVLAEMRRRTQKAKDAKMGVVTPDADQVNAMGTPQILPTSPPRLADPDPSVQAVRTAPPPTAAAPTPSPYGNGTMGPDPAAAARARLMSGSADARQNIYDNSNELVQWKRAHPGQDAGELQEQTIGQNIRLRTEAALADRAMAPSPVVRTPDENSGFIRRSNQSMMENIGQQLKTTDPTSPQYADLKRAYDSFATTASGQTPEVVGKGAALTALNPYAGPAVTVGTGLRGAADDFARRGVDATASQNRASEYAGVRRDAAMDEFMKRSGNRLAAEDNEKQLGVLGAAAQKSNMEQMLSRSRQGTAEADTATAMAKARNNPEQLKALMDAEVSRARAGAAQAGADQNIAQKNAAAQTAIAGRDAALKTYNFGGDKLPNLKASVGSFKNVISDFITGKVAGTSTGGGEEYIRKLNAIDDDVNTIEKMSQTDPETAKEIASSILNEMPLPNQETGDYTNAGVWGGGDILNPGNWVTGWSKVKTRENIARGLSVMRRRLLAVKNK